MPPKRPRKPETQDPDIEDGGRPSHEEVFTRILRRLQREENFGSIDRRLKGRQARDGATNNDERSAGQQRIEQMLDPSKSGRCPSGGSSAVNDNFLSPHRPLTQGSRPKDNQEELPEERMFGNSPPPPTLRLIIEDVRKHVEQKLALAGMCSLRDAMRLMFECRTMLDKTLKEIPNHHNVREATSIEAITGVKEADPGAGVFAQKLQEMFQEFKRVPVVIPASTYAIDKSNGKYEAQLIIRDGSTVNANATGPLGGETNTGMLPDIGGSQSARFRGPQPPTREARRRASGDSDADGFGDQQPQMSAVVPSRSSQFQRPEALIKEHRDQQLLLRHLRRQTQLVSESCQTEESIAKQVSEDELNAEISLRHRKEIEIDKLKGDIERLKDQLTASENARAARGKVVKFLRESLHTENMRLRSSLNQANMKAASLNSTHKDHELAALLGHDYAQMHSMLNIVLLAVERDEILNLETGERTVSWEDQLRTLQTKFKKFELKAKSELRHEKQSHAMQIKRKNDQLKMIKLATDVSKLRTVILTAIHGVKDEFDGVRRDIKTALDSTFQIVATCSDELDYGCRRASLEVASMRQLQEKQRALSDAIRAQEDLLVPVMKQEFSTGNHTWPYAKQNEPLLSFITQQHGPEAAQSIQEELVSMHHIFLQVQRFSLRVFNMPDMHRPGYGSILWTLGTRMIVNQQCPDDVAQAVRNALDKDRLLAGKQARINLQLKYQTYRKHTMETRIRSALEEADIVTEQLPENSELRALSSVVDRLRGERLKLEQSRGENARSLFMLWRSSQLDIFEGKRPPVTRDPEAIWNPSSIQVKSKARPAPVKKAPISPRANREK